MYLTIIRQALTLAIGGLGLAWGILVLPYSQAVDDLLDIERRLLRSEAFSTSDLALVFQSQEASQDLSACDSDSQRAMLLMEIPLAEAALRSGASNEFDRHILSLETRSRLVLGCTPRDSFAWLLAFNLELVHGRLNEQALNLLAMSYETSPNEAWISTRRIVVAMPLVAIAPEPLRKKILSEFQQLISSGYEGAASRSYLAAPQPVRSMLLDQIKQLSISQQKAFSEALQKLRS
jgi:hypothetical protein